MKHHIKKFLLPLSEEYIDMELERMSSICYPFFSLVAEDESQYPYPIKIDKPPFDHVYQITNTLSSKLLDDLAMQLNSFGMKLKIEYDRFPAMCYFNLANLEQVLQDIDINFIAQFINNDHSKYLRGIPS